MDPMTPPPSSAAQHAARALGRDLPEPDPRPSWEQHADRHRPTTQKTTTTEETP